MNKLVSLVACLFVSQIIYAQTVRVLFLKHQKPAQQMQEHDQLSHDVVNTYFQARTQFLRNCFRDEPQIAFDTLVKRNDYNFASLRDTHFYAEHEQNMIILSAKMDCMPHELHNGVLLNNENRLFKYKMLAAYKKALNGTRTDQWVQLDAETKARFVPGRVNNFVAETIMPRYKLGALYHNYLTGNVETTSPLIVKHPYERERL